jgi:metal-responsive CopG/Arc/MetJ family transcriptional regulator
MRKVNVKIRKELLDKAERCARAAGYSSTEEFVEHVLEKELAKLDDAVSEEDLVRKLKGLGYID